MAITRSRSPGAKPKRDRKLGPIGLPTDATAIRKGFYFDKAAGQQACDFIEAFCRHSEGDFAGQPFLVEKWQRDFLLMLYGWKRPDGTRRFREAYVEVPKKNGKSTLLSAMALYGLFEEPGAQVYPGAVDREQAGIVFEGCANMVAASPTLQKHLEVIPSKKRIVYRANNAFLQTMSADVPSKDGIKGSLVILDELHRFASPAMYDVVKYSGRSRSQPILASITTAGHDRKSICWEQHERARAVLDGSSDDLKLLPIIYAANPDDDLDDPRTWKKANPSMGAILSLEDFKDDHSEARMIPRLWNLFLRLRLNIWTDQETRWLDVALWDRGCDPVEPGSLEGRQCHAAIDCSTVKDLTSIVLAFPEDDDIRLVPYFFMPADTVRERSERDNVPYRQWIDAGWMIETPGNATDFNAIREKMAQLYGEHEVASVGLDPWNAAQLTNDLMDLGFDVVEVRQGYRTLTNPSKEFERRLLAGTLKHDGNPVMRWCVQNVATETDSAGNIKPSKKKSNERIDGVVAGVMAIGLTMGPKAPTPGYTSL